MIVWYMWFYMSRDLKFTEEQGKDEISVFVFGNFQDCTDYLYYILQKDNSHYFTKSYDDFLKKKKELGY